MLHSLGLTIGTVLVFLGVSHGLATPEGGGGAGSGAERTAPGARSGVGVAPRSADGTSLAVPEAHRLLGVVFAKVDGAASRIGFTSDSPVEKFQGESRAVVGYVVVGDLAAALKGEVAPRLPAGGFRVACESITTGVTLRDEHMLGERWLDAERHPDIGFAVTGFQNATRSLDGTAGMTWVGTLTGELEIRGKLREVEIPGARVTVIAGTEATKRGAVATPPRVSIECRFDVALRDYGMEASVLGVSVAERLRVEETIVLMP